MQPAGSPPALAEAADVLSSQLQAHLRRLAKLLRPHAAVLEARFLRRLRQLRFDAKQCKALAAITPYAASRILAGKRPPSDFFEQVEYNGRRLAKLNLPPGRVVQALRESDRLLAAVFRTAPPRDRENLQWVLEQLSFCVVLTLNNAFYQVREAETQAYQELFHAELESQNLGELLRGMLETLARFCHAQAAALFLLDAETSEWQQRSATTETGTPDVPPVKVPNTPARSRRVLRPRCATEEEKTGQLALDPRWRGRYRSCWSIPLAARGRTAGVMQFAFRTAYEWLPRELELLTAAAERCLLAAEKARLVEELATREELLRRLAGHMMQVEERERKRISSELHDEAGQSLLCIRLRLEMLEKAAPAEFRASLSEARALTESTIVEIRRLIGDLSPAVLEQLGLSAALRQLAKRLRHLHRMRIKLQISCPRDLPTNLARVVYRLIQECTNNIARHSSASLVNISVISTDGELRLCVDDDGVGFDVEEALGKRDSFGLAGIRERVALFGGKFHVHSRPGRGTKILIELPTLGPGNGQTGKER